MAYSRELLDSALLLYGASPETQATLRRAISTAYYALFHLLIEEATANWVRPEQRAALARMFGHGIMAGASDSRIRKYKNAASDSAESHLHSVARAFYQLQQERHKADYDLSNSLSVADVDLAIRLAEEAFVSWNAIRNEQIGPDYLFSLLFKERS